MHIGMKTRFQTQKKEGARCSHRDFKKARLYPTWYRFDCTTWENALLEKAEHFLKKCWWITTQCLKKQSSTSRSPQLCLMVLRPPINTNSFSMPCIWRLLSNWSSSYQPHIATGSLWRTHNCNISCIMALSFPPHTTAAVWLYCTCGLSIDLSCLCAC